MVYGWKKPENTVSVNKKSRQIASEHGYNDFIKCGNCGGRGKIWYNYSVGTIRCPDCHGCGYLMPLKDKERYVLPFKED